MPKPVKGEWREAVDAVVKKCELGVTFGMPVTFDPTGAKALRDLIAIMANVLDGKEMDDKS